jgi:hypothetical protein
MTTTNEPSAMRAILHVGDMKCGSTSIQEWMTRDRALLQENGFWLSDVTRIAHYDSRLSSFALDDDRMDVEARRECGIGSPDEVPAHRRDIEERLATEVKSLPSSAQAMIFSHELMLLLRPREVGRLVTMLRRMFSGIHVVAYIRRQDRLFLSLWGQRLKSYAPEPNFFERQLQRRSYLRMLDTWSAAVGRENFVVRVFDKSSFAQGDLQSDFRDAARIPHDARHAPPCRTNESLDAAAQSLLFELGKRLDGNSSLERRRLWNRIRRAFQPEAKRRANVPMIPPSLKTFLVRHRTGRSLLPDRAWATRIMESCSRENELIRRRYFPERDRLFDDDFSEYPTEGGPPGTNLRLCAPEEFAQPAVGSVTPEDIVEAYRIVLGRAPDPRVVAHEANATANIAQVYASLLARSRAA